MGTSTPIASRPLADPAGELQIGNEITVWYKSGSGQGGIVVGFDFPGDADPECQFHVHLECGEAKRRRMIDLNDETIDRVERHEFLDPTECLEYGDNCKGNVDWCGTPGGGAQPRCEHHDQKRWERYESSMERYADSDVVPSWFDPADAGEHWDSDY